MTQIVLAGTGLLPGQMTLETYQRLRSCRRLFLVNLPQEQQSYLRIFFAHAEIIPGRLGNSDLWEMETAKLLFDCAMQDEDVGIMLSGHPLLYTLGALLCRESLKKKIACSVLPAPSFYDGVLALMAKNVKDCPSEVFAAPMMIGAADELLRGYLPLHSHCSAFIINLFLCGLGKDNSGVRRLVSILSRVYTSDARCFLVHVGGAEGREGTVLSLRLKSLEQSWLEANEASTLFIPFRQRGRK